MDDRKERLRRRLGELVADKWRLDALIGVGGMAAVYRAVHVRNGHRVAVKVLHPHVSHHETIVARFLREGYVANKLRHPAVVPAIDDGTLSDGSPYIVMEYLDGYALDTHLSRTKTALRPPMSETEAADVLRVLVEILAAAEPLNLIHRDIKPANIFRVNDGTYRLLDFGIALLEDGLDGDQSQTATGISVGSPAYMPPEQARARRELVGPHSDRFAAAAATYALLTGTPPRTADTQAEVFALAMLQPLPSIATKVPIRPAFAAVIDRALAFEIGDRFPSAAAMQAALAAAMATPPLPVDQDGLTQVRVAPGSAPRPFANTLPGVETGSSAVAVQTGPALFPVYGTEGTLGSVTSGSTVASAASPRLIPMVAGVVALALIGGTAAFLYRGHATSANVRVDPKPAEPQPADRQIVPAPVREDTLQAAPTKPPPATEPTATVAPTESAAPLAAEPRPAIAVAPTTKKGGSPRVGPTGTRAPTQAPAPPASPLDTYK